MRLVRAALALALALVTADAASSSDQDAEEDGVTSCWLVDTAETAVLSTYSGGDCPVQLSLVSSAAVYAVNATLSLLWEVALPPGGTNDLDMPLPPPATVTLSPDNAGERVQVVASYVRTCSARDECDPTATSGSNFSSVLSGNFTGDDQDEPLYFSSIGELWFSEEGAQLVSAVAVVGDASDPSIAYYFATVLEVQIVKQEAIDGDMVYDKASTYCRMSSQSPLDDTLLESSLLLATSSGCEVSVSVDSPDVVQAGAETTIDWTAVLVRNSSASILLPSPLIAVDVTGGDDDESVYYTVASAVIKLCTSKDACTEYSDDVNVSSKTLSGNFTADGVASFTPSGIVLPQAGWYSGVAQITLGAEDDDARYDFTSYFNMLATQEDVATQVESEAFATDGSASYCWEVIGSADAVDINAASVYALASDSDCPYAVSMSASNTTLIASSANLALEWVVIQQPSYSRSVFSDINLTAVVNASTDEYVELAQMNVYVCNTTGVTATSSASCSPFAANKTTLYSARPSNFSSDGEARYSVTNLELSTPGTYTLVVHAVVANGDDSSRVDVASFVTFQVSSPASSSSSDVESSSGSSTGTLIGIFCGVIGGIVVIALVIVTLRRRRRTEDKPEDPAVAKSGMFGFRPLSVTNELPTDSRGSLHSNASEESGSFLYVKAQRSPVDVERYSSLSYDPYSRRSFTEPAADSSPRYSFVLSDRELSPASSGNDGDSLHPSTPTYPA